MKLKQRGSAKNSVGAPKRSKGSKRQGADPRPADPSVEKFLFESGIAGALVRWLEQSFPPSQPGSQFRKRRALYRMGVVKKETESDREMRLIGAEIRRFEREVIQVILEPGTKAQRQHLVRSKPSDLVRIVALYTEILKQYLEAKKSRLEDRETSFVTPTVLRLARLSLRSARWSGRVWITSDGRDPAPPRDRGRDVANEKFLRSWLPFLIAAFAEHHGRRASFIVKATFRRMHAAGLKRPPGKRARARVGQMPSEPTVRRWADRLTLAFPDKTHPTFQKLKSVLV